MKLRTGILVLCLCLVLSSCGTAPSVVAPTKINSASMTAQQVRDLYDPARAAVQAEKDLNLRIRYTRNRRAEDVYFTDSVEAVANYTGRGTEALEAAIEETRTYGTQTHTDSLYYRDGLATSRIGGRNFSTPMTGEEFLAMQVPEILVDTENYQTFSLVKTGAWQVITFSDPKKPEAWAAPETAELLSAVGSATLDMEGRLISTEYVTEYRQGPAVYRVKATVELDPLAKTQQPAPEPGECVPLQSFGAPLQMLQAIGDLESAQAVGGRVTETMTDSVMTRTLTQKLNFWGSGEKLLAEVNQTEKIVKNNAVSGSSQEESFRDGKYTSSLEGNRTAEEMEEYCRRILLSTLLTPEAVQDAEMETVAEFQCLEFVCTPEAARELGLRIRKVTGGSAGEKDVWTATGYLTLDAETGLPTAMGFRAECDGAVYQRDLKLTLSSSQVWTELTGESQSNPGGAATPLVYRVTGPDGQSMYLMGTLPVGDYRTLQLPKKLEEILQQVDFLATECNPEAFEAPSAADITHLTGIYYCPEGGKTQDFLEPQIFTKAKRMMMATGNWNVDSPFVLPILWQTDLAHYRVNQTQGLNTGLGIKQKLLTMAEAYQKPVLEIETGIARLEMLAAYPAPLQQKMLEDIIDRSQEEYTRTVQQLYEVWCRGNETELEEALALRVQADAARFGDMYEAYRSAVYLKRNAGLLETAKAYLSSGTEIFMAVGFDHVMGPDGLLQLLKDSGFTVQPVEMN